MRRSKPADCTQAVALFPPSSPSEQPAASGQQPPNCWGERVLPYLIALDDVIDLPQVLAATCFVAHLQQNQAYFLLSQFSCSNFSLYPLLKYAERKTVMGREKYVKVNVGVKRNDKRESKKKGSCEEGILWSRQ